MKVRRTVRCERCRGYILPGGMAVRVYGRLWHPHCAISYAQARRERRGQIR